MTAPDNGPGRISGTGCHMTITFDVLPSRGLPGPRVLALMVAGLLGACSAPEREFPQAALPAFELATDPAANPTPVNLPAASMVSPPAQRTGGEAVTATALDRAVRMAVASHPSISQASALFGQQSEQIREARSGYYPQVSLQAGTNNRDDGLGASVVGNQMLYDFGKVDSDVDLASAGSIVRQAGLLQAVDDLVRDTAVAFIEVQRNRALLDVARDQSAGIAEIAGLVGQRGQQGASSRSDVVQAEARIQEARSREITIESDLARVETDFVSLTGSTEAIDGASGLPGWIGNACSGEAPDWARVPAVLRAEGQLREALAQGQQARAQSRPTLALQLEGAPGIGSQDSDVVVGLDLSTNVLQGGAQGAQRNAALYALRAAESASANARLSIERDYAEARSRLSNLDQLSQTLTTRGGLMTETGDLYRVQYFQLGTRTLLDLLNAEQERHQVSFEMVEAEHDRRRAQVDCLHASGLMRSSFGLIGASAGGVVIDR